MIVPCRLILSAILFAAPLTSVSALDSDPSNSRIKNRGPDASDTRNSSPPGDLSRGTATSASGIQARTLSERFSDVSSIREFGAPIDGDWTAAVQAAEASSATHIMLPAGQYPTTLNHYQAVTKTYVGPGQLVVGADAKGKGGTREAPFRAFYTAPLPQLPSGYSNAFDGDTSKMAIAAYTLSTSKATPPTAKVYTLMPQLAQTLRVYENGAGFQANTGNQSGGRSGGAMDWRYLNHNGNGDFGLEFNRVQVAGDTPGATHFLAKPASSFTGGDIVAAAGSADGKYLQISEHNVYDNGTAAAVIGRTINYHRTNSGTGLSQVWIHDRAALPVDVPIDAIYAPGSGKAKSGVDLSAVDFSLGAQAAIVLAPGQRIYFGGHASPDSAGLITHATSLGLAQISMDTNGYIHIDPGAGKALIIDNLPTAATGLPSGSVWRDAAAGNVLKAVP